MRTSAFRVRLGSIVLLALASTSVGCVTEGPVTADAALPDAGRADAGGADAGAGDAARPDAGADAFVADPVPAFRTPVATPDLELARAALRILGSAAAGATEESCAECHTLTQQRIRYWRALSDSALSTCLDDLAVTSDASAARMVDCIRASGSFTTAPMGVFATAADLGWFRYVFRHGSGTPDWTTTHAGFVASAVMPPPPDRTTLTQEQFDIVAEWFIRGVPQLDAVLPDDPRPTECLPGVSDDVVAHATEMATSGWSAINAGSGMLMHGCAGATSAAGCLATETLARDTTFGAGWETIADGVPGAHLRVLFTTDYATAYWTRTSADGRFVSHGATADARLRFIDLQTDRVIGGNALYDPMFFPDGSGFIVQGSGGARVCESRVLTTGAPTSLTFTEAGCTAGSGIGLYEHVGTALSGGDYWAIDGSSEYDNGGQDVTRGDPDAPFDSRASADLTLMVNDGTGFVIGGTERIDTPYEGDAVISPSLRLLVTRASGATGQLGYVLRRVDVTGSGATLSVAIPEVARYCTNGGKPGFSYDERWLVIHHYIGDADAEELGFTGATDPAFAEYRTRGASNIYLIDLTTGVRTRITNMGPGQYALFPHFRSDGWIYFIVRSVDTPVPADVTPEHVVASDAALLYPE